MSTSPPPAAAADGAFAPLRNRVFLVLWLATLLGNVGTWMRDVASGWVMATLAPSPLMVALVQAATTLPVFLLALPAGALSDILDRRRILIAVQIALALVSATLAAAAGFGVMTPWLLLALTLLGGIGAALVAPAWQSIVPELVPRAQLKSAVALNSLGFNISRAIGPALGGAVLVSLGAAATYLADAASYLIAIAALVWWRREAKPSTAPPERLAGAMRAGLRYAAASPALRRVLLRAAIFFLSASALWALLPLIVRERLGGDAALFGFMLAAIGLGAVGGALLMPRLRRHLGPDAALLLAAAGVAAVVALLALVPDRRLALPLMLVAGAAWILALTTLSATAQAVLPDWVRGRGIALYLTVFSGAMTLGSVAWGQIASLSSIPTALLTSAATGVLLALALRPLRLPSGDLDLTPARHWPMPEVAIADLDARGSVMVTVEYEIADADRDAFLAGIRLQAQERRRDGAISWHIHEDAERPGRFIESFVEASWDEHMRHHARVTDADRVAENALRALHRGTTPPRVTHWLAPGP